MATAPDRGSRTPDATPSTKERERAEESLARASRPRTFGLVVGGGLAAAVGFGLLLLPVLGLFFLLYFGAMELFGDGVPSGREATDRDRTVARVVLLSFAVGWIALFQTIGFRTWRREVRKLRLVAGGEPSPRTLATFHSSRFNTTEEKETFVNPGCFGDDVVQHSLDGLAADGIEVDPEPGAEDFGWYGRFRLGEDDAYDLIVSFQPDETGDTGMWWIHVERAGMPMSANRRRRGGVVQVAAVSAVHDVLARTDGIEGLRWYFDQAAVEAA